MDYKGPKKWLVQSSFDLSNLFLLFLHTINRHVSSIFFEIYNSVAFFIRRNSREHFLHMSVRETSLPESYKIFSKKWNRNLRAETDALLLCVCQSCSKIPRLFFFSFCALGVTGHAWHPTSFEFSTHAQHMSRRMLEASSIPDLSRKIEGDLNAETLEKQEKGAIVQIKFHNLIIQRK